LREQLRKAIRESGQTLGQISRKCGVGPDRLSRFLRGERDLTLTGAEKICEALGLQLATKSGLATGQPAFQQERSRHVLSDTQAGAEAAAPAFGDMPANPGEDVDIHLALEPELAGLIQWFERNFCQLPREPLQLSEWCKWDDPKRFYEDCKAMCEAIKRNDPRADPEWLKRWVGGLREHFEGKL
jgi:transcriptional regulator with XRE-family HTH domain